MQLDDGALSDTKPPLASRDAELLLSYLTVPYLRIPLLLEFFGWGDRVWALQSQQLQKMLERALFEPGPFRPADQPMMGDVEVPSKPENTGESARYGLLLNELTQSGPQLIRSLETLLRHTLYFDSYSMDDSMADVILYLARLAARAR